MKVLGLALCLALFWATWALAQGFPNIPTSAESDSLVIRDSSEGHLAEVEFHNSAASTSGTVDRVFEWGDVRVRVKVEIGSALVDYAEILTVEPLSHEYLAFPPEAHVKDGDTFVVQIMLPMF